MVPTKWHSNYFYPYIAALNFLKACLICCLDNSNSRHYRKFIKYNLIIKKKVAYTISFLLIHLGFRTSSQFTMDMLIIQLKIKEHQPLTGQAQHMANKN